MRATAGRVTFRASPIQPHLYDDVREGLYTDALRSLVAPAVPGDYDVIALCDPAWDDSANVHFVCARENSDGRRPR